MLANISANNYNTDAIIYTIGSYRIFYYIHTLHIAADSVISNKVLFY
jgi:hypothetical protein